MKSYKKKIILYTLKTIAYTFCALGCAYQVISILNLYFSFPTTVFSFVEIMNRLELPAITFCTNNLIMLDKMKQIDPEFNQSWTKLLEISEQNSNQTRLLKQKLIDQTIRKLMDQLSVYDFSQLGTEWNDLLQNQYFKCATDPYNVDKKCINHSNIIQSAQELGNCFTVFRWSENRTLKDIAIKSGISQSPVIRGVEDSLNLEIADQPFHPNEVFRMMINFSLNQRTTLNEKVMGHLAIHDEKELPPIRNRNFIVYPGYYYEFYISKESGKYLASPYVTDCINYDREKIWTTTMDTSKSQINVMSRETCIMNCLAKNTINLCKCWPPELPFIVIDHNNQSNHLKWCSWRDGTNIIVTNSSKERNWFRYCFARHEKQCKNLCKIECKSDSYEVMRQKVIWPSQERIDHSEKYDMTLRECCTLISIRFWSSEQSIQDYQPKYEFVEFISYFGGLLSIWLGFSLVKTYDIGELVSRKIIIYIWQYVKHFISKRKLQPSRTTKIRPRVTRYLK
ncbi:uncharacterized protein LOC113791626 [Dermatophagoides pteronyssinus]|uniref:uncharacterized protein LOC113791626 n=1 Tax=Dermatophagoides pteronyssinus TaxID=6956 RepID=UPI003F676392